jgi:hypothetical protein
MAAVLYAQCVRSMSVHSLVYSYMSLYTLQPGTAGGAAGSSKGSGGSSSNKGGSSGSSSSGIAPRLIAVDVFTYVSEAVDSDSAGVSALA